MASVTHLSRGILHEHVTTKTSAFPNVRIHESTYVDEPVQIGEGTSIWHFCHILGEVTIGRHCSIGQNVMIGPRVTVGDNCKIQNNVSLYEGVTLEDDVFCGPSCVFTNVVNPRSAISRKSEFRPTLVKRGATIGATRPSFAVTPSAAMPLSRPARW